MPQSRCARMPGQVTRSNCYMVLTTPDGRYIIVRGRLWRASNPSLGGDERQAAVDSLMDARRAVKDAKGDAVKVKTARADVQAAKVRLGERGAVWWSDGSPDYDRHLARNTPYAEWFALIDIAS